MDFFKPKPKATPTPPVIEEPIVVTPLPVDQTTPAPTTDSIEQNATVTPPVVAVQKLEAVTPQPNLDQSQNITGQTTNEKTADSGIVQPVRQVATPASAIVKPTPSSNVIPLSASSPPVAKQQPRLTSITTKTSGSSSNSTSSPTGSNVSVPIILGIVVVICALATLLGILFLQRQKRSNQKFKEQMAEGDKEMYPTYARSYIDINRFANSPATPKHVESGYSIDLYTNMPQDIDNLHSMQFAPDKSPQITNLHSKIVDDTDQTIASSIAFNQFGINSEGKNSNTVITMATSIASPFIAYQHHDDKNTL